MHDQTDRIRTIKIVIVAASLVLTIGSFSAIAQSSANTAEARKHYQNAVASIAKDDWQAALRELLLAEQLAPQNALVHYDLALAYSHTGRTKSAQAEVATALQLGLPRTRSAPLPNCDKR